MTTRLEIRAQDKSTFVVTASFFDEDEAAVTPLTLTWSLRNGDGDIVNSRENVVVASLSTTAQIVLYGDDLDFADGPTRVLTLTGTYTSTLGVGLPLKDETIFDIDDLQGV